MADAAPNILNDPHSPVISTPSRGATEAEGYSWESQMAPETCIRQMSLTLCLCLRGKSEDKVLNQSNSQVCSQNKMLNSKAGKDMEVITQAQKQSREDNFNSRDRKRQI